MTREQMIELAKWVGSLYTLPADAPYWSNGVFEKDCIEAEAALRQMAEQQPVECNPADYCTARHIKCYAAPVPAVDLAEWKWEAMRLAESMAQRAQFSATWDHPSILANDLARSRADFAAHLEKL